MFLLNLLQSNIEYMMFLQLLNPPFINSFMCGFEQSKIVLLHKRHTRCEKKMENILPGECPKCTQHMVSLAQMHIKTQRKNLVICQRQQTGIIQSMLST
jgi:hypothetical protein